MNQGLDYLRSRWLEKSCDVLCVNYDTPLRVLHALTRASCEIKEKGCLLGDEGLVAKQYSDRSNLLA